MCLSQPLTPRRDAILEFPIRIGCHAMDKAKNILITGGTGFIGTHLTNQLRDSGYHVTILSRNADALAKQSPSGGVEYRASLDSIDPDVVWRGIINLAGEPLSAGRWNTERKAEFRTSRIDTTASLSRWIGRLPVPPAVLLSGSAIGWYGHCEDEVLDEASPANDGYSHRLCRDWEQAAMESLPSATRGCAVRIGIVLGSDGGPLLEMLRPARLGLGGPMGSGQQWWSWVHIDDLVRLFIFLLENESVSGVVNATAPVPVTQREFAKSLGKVLSRPAIIPLPAAIAELVLGEFAREVLLNGQQVVPAAALSAGFRFTYSELVPALQELLGKS
ncbi:MAG: hypothetical protein ACI89U_000392 [Gammaproteobacteria bacterium]|jgi:uncharacterized protein (TIGR01777 family)